MADINIKQAQAALKAALAKAEEIGTKMNIAVVDAGANLKAFVRMDDAWLGSIDIAIKKARTARFFTAAIAGVLNRICSSVLCSRSRSNSWSCPAITRGSRGAAAAPGAATTSTNARA